MIKKPSEHVFETIIGHDLPKRLLIKTLEKNRLPNAFLFAGMEGIGKKSIAYAFVKTLNCLVDNGGINCSCNICRKIREEKTIDHYHIKPSGAINQISVDDIREFHDNASIYPVEFRKKILFIHDADRLNINAANALLKLLEEPPKHLLIFLFTNSLSSLMPTIRSRCTLVQFHPIPWDILKEWIIKEMKISKNEAEIAAFFSEGSPKKAFEVISGDITKKRDLISEIYSFFYQHGFNSIHATSYKLLSSCESSEEVFKMTLIWFRDVLLLSLLHDDFDKENNQIDVLINFDKIKQLKEFADKVPPPESYNIIKSIIEYNHLTKRITNEDLLMRVFLTEINQIKSNMIDSNFLH